jgi:hypothetical protein
MQNMITTESTSNPKAQNPLRFILPVAALLVLVAGAFIAYQAWSSAQQEIDEARLAEMQAEAMAAIEDRWGIRVTQVAATADGGLVDLRYEITDPDKAIFLWDDLNNVPRLITGDEKIEIAVNSLPHEHDLEFGQTYFIIYRNVANAVEPGERVTLMVGDLSVEHFAVAQ